MKKISTMTMIVLLSWSLHAQMTIGLMQNDSLAQNGYTLFSPDRNSYLIDNCGYLVNKWTSSFRVGLSAYILPNGNLIRTGFVNGDFQGGGIGGRIEEFNWEGDLIWSSNFATFDFHQHHDVEPLPNGNILVILWQRHSREDAIAAGRYEAWINSPGLWTTRIIEIKKMGSENYEIVWEWDFFDHLIQDRDSTKLNYGVVSEHPELLDINFDALAGTPDWIHCNAVDYNESLDQITISSRHLDEIYIIDHSTTIEESKGSTGGRWGKGGDILYRYGNPQAYKRGDAGDRKLYGQHDVRWIPDDYPNGGKLMVFNNGLGRPGGSSSSVDIFQPPMDSAQNYILPETDPFGPAELSWTYDDQTIRFYSSNISGAHPLPNGNVLITSGRQGDFFEVDMNSKWHWYYKNTVSGNGPAAQGSNINNNNVFRATKYPAEYVGFDGRDLEPSMPIELNPIAYDCEIYPTILSSVNSPILLEDIQIYPNPFQDFIQIKNEVEGRTLEIQVLNVTGHVILGTQFSQEHINLDVSNWPGGIYFLSLYDPKKQHFYNSKMIKYE